MVTGIGDVVPYSNNHFETRTMHFRTLLTLLLLTCCAVVHATHVPPSTASVIYDGAITASDTDFSGSLTSSDGYDFFTIDVLSGQSVVFDVSSPTLLPNIHVYGGVGTAGDTVAGLGDELFDFDNSVSNSISGVTWTPMMDYSATVVLSTWLGEVGDYNLTVIGAAAAVEPENPEVEEEMGGETPQPEPEMGDPTAVPEPASLVAWALLFACVVPVALRRRNARS